MLLWLRYIILALSVVGAVTFYLWGKRTGNLTRALPVFLWLVNVAAFHAYRLWGATTDPILLNNWSLSIHLQAVLSLAMVGVLLAREGK